MNTPRAFLADLSLASGVLGCPLPRPPSRHIPGTWAGTRPSQFGAPVSSPGEGPVLPGPSLGPAPQRRLLPPAVPGALRRRACVLPCWMPAAGASEAERGPELPR